MSHYLEELMKNTVGRQIFNTQNTCYKDMSSETRGGIEQLHDLLSFLLWEVQKYSDSEQTNKDTQKQTNKQTLVMNVHT